MDLVIRNDQATDWVVVTLGTFGSIGSHLAKYRCGHEWKRKRTTWLRNDGPNVARVIAPSSQGTMYAMSAHLCTGALLQVYCSTDGGDNWTACGNAALPMSRFYRRILSNRKKKGLQRFAFRGINTVHCHGCR